MKRSLEEHDVWQPSFRTTVRQRVQGRRRILTTVLLALWSLFVPGHSKAATNQASGTLALRIEPAVTFSVLPLGSSTSPLASPTEPATREELVQIDLAVRMNPGTTATLRLYPASLSGVNRSGLLALKDLLTINRNGRYSVTVAISSPDGSVGCNPCRIELKSSDDALDRSVVFQFP